MQLDVKKEASSKTLFCFQVQAAEERGPAPEYWEPRGGGGGGGADLPGRRPARQTGGESNGDCISSLYSKI